MLGSMVDFYGSFVGVFLSLSFFVTFLAVTKLETDILGYFGKQHIKIPLYVDFFIAIALFGAICELISLSLLKISLGVLGGTIIFFFMFAVLRLIQKTQIK